MNEQQLSEIAIDQKRAIPDSELTSLSHLVAKRARLPGESRFDYARNPEGTNTTNDRRAQEMSDETAEKAKQYFGGALNLMLDMAETRVISLTRTELNDMYNLAVQTVGLSKLDAEELAPHSVQWLEFCINPSVTNGV